MIQQKDSLEFLQGQKDFAFDINYSDPPYALGSEIYIRPDGKFDYKKATDFMNKWEMPTGEYWEKWFEESFRTLKHGGYCIMFGIDLQLPMFQYYAIKAGFQVRQSMYWYFISNFPKSSNLSDNIDKSFKVKRTVVGKKKAMENQEQKLLENASKKLETLLELKRFAKKIGNYDLAQKCEEIELEKFPLSQEEIDADEEAEKLNLAFRMVELGIDKQTCYRIARTLEQLKKKKGKFSIADSAKIVVDSKRVFLRSEKK
jgi:hypothetical protein